MTRDLASPGFNHSTLASLGAPREQVIVMLLDALQKLADAGEVDAACRIAGKACAVLRRSDAKSERRFNALLHRLTRKLGSVDQARMP
jgi:hypothetical protein